MDIASWSILPGASIGGNRRSRNITTYRPTFDGLLEEELEKGFLAQQFRGRPRPDLKEFLLLAGQAVGWCLHPEGRQKIDLPTLLNTERARTRLGSSRSGY